MPLFEHQGRALSLLDEGAGAPVLLIHSGGLSSRQWRGLSSQLRANHRVLSPDLLGYGGSTALAPGADFHFREDLEMVSALLASLGEPAHLVGHSYGGLLALLAAAHTPSQARSLSLFEPVAFGILRNAAPGSADAKLQAGEAASMRALASDENGAGGSEPWLESFVDWWQGAGVWRSLPEPSRTAFLAVGRKTYLEVRSLLADETPASAYRDIPAPALILRGERSPQVEQRVCARLAEALPHARLETISNAGHMGPLTHMGAVNRLIAAHIDA